MAQVILLVYNFIFSTTVDFYVGEHLQQTTAGALVETSKNNGLILSCSASASEIPSITST